MSQLPSIRFGSSWSTQLRLTQAIGRALSEITPVNATIVVGERSVGGLQSGEVDAVFLKSVVNEHLVSGKGYYAAKEPATWLRTIAWLPQEDRMFFAVAPWTGIKSFEDIAAQKPALQMVGRVGAPLLKAYGFSYEDIERWGGKTESLPHTAKAAKARYDAGPLDAWFGDGSAYDGTNWTWLADRGYQFLDIREDVMAKLEREQGLRLDEQEINGVTTYVIELERDLVMTETTKVFKAAAFRRRADGTLEGWVSDDQVGFSATRVVADFWQRKFLGCALVNTPATEMQAWFEQTQRFINSPAVPDAADRAALEAALLAEANSQRTTVSPTGFANDNMDAATRQSYLNSLRDSGSPARQFHKDISLIKAKVRQVSMTLAGGIRVSAPPEEWADGGSISTNGNGTAISITIEGEVQQVRGGSR